MELPTIQTRRVKLGSSASTRCRAPSIHGARGFQLQLSRPFHQCGAEFSYILAGPVMTRVAEGRVDIADHWPGHLSAWSASAAIRLMGPVFSRPDARQRVPRGRVGAGDCSPAPLTEPDLRVTHPAPQVAIYMSNNRGCVTETRRGGFNRCHWSTNEPTCSANQALGYARWMP